MERPEYEVLYGGAAGGGKSDALVIEALRQVEIPNYKAIIFRKTFPQCRELIGKSLLYYKGCYPRAKYNASNHCWTFPSGAKIYFGSLPNRNSMYNFQGHEYDFIAFDELTHFTYEEYKYLLSRNRPSGGGTRVYTRSTCNPGGIGHGWVKERFITPAPPMTEIWEEAKVLGETRRRARMFVPSSVFDNPALLKNDPNYVTNLALLPEAQKKALLYGDWDSFEGQVFSEWKNDPAHYQDRRFTHVCAPFGIPGNWRIYRGLDWGYAKPYSVGWYAVDTEGVIYRIRELYGCTGEPNVGVKEEPAQVAARIREIEETDPNIRGKHVTGIADPAIFASDKGESIAGMMERGGVFFEKGDHTRIAGKMQFHYRFAFNELGFCRFYTFSTCRNFIRTIPALVYDAVNVEDVDSAGEDHIYDECRYVLMENPVAPLANTKVVRQWNPLEKPQGTAVFGIDF
ncbi:MAG TPA: Terminase-like family protein [Candidatus Avimonoglobus intestinipullorum]|uniref:Terminase-like family protein n=1 Tax=Candidatus Avimonoglobus intestinipullorum TaxID=2840699 RepID=A0A9D1LVE2_9FIRM|nr:Terminase-like family protein [Candidatus Avimonoglobus intestinipullorum]